ncbi:carbohydrate kinase family protein [Niallia sp. 01092]|uniref:carbohydrate kinase family protein n=1 Tax=unclassified Niallia TaxID=2837522 RepID=UPI003FD393FB
MKKQGIVSLGDAFIDYISTNRNNDEFKKKLGGASVNVAVHVSRLGIQSYYVTKLGKYEDSLFVQQEMEKESIHLKYSVFSSEKEICGVYVHLDDKGERHFHSYINNTPDDVVKEEDIVVEAFQNKKIFYFGSGTLFHLQARKATEKAIKFAKANQLIVSFDANIRLQRWKSEQECRNTIKQFFHALDVLKLSEEELLFLFEVQTVEEGLKALEQYNIPVIFITMGEKGAYGLLSHQAIKVNGETIEAKDTNGAGDAFMAAILYNIYEQGLPTSLEELKRYVQLGNLLGGMVATKIGALPSKVNYNSIVSCEQDYQ